MRTSSLTLTLTLTLAAALATSAGCSKHTDCAAGETDCGGTCVNLLDDEDNCGACGAAVSSLEICSAGSPACAPGTEVCGGACTDLARDPDHCGSCTTACASGEYCTTASGATSCTTSCPTDYTACERACVDLQTDRLNCSACGSACATGQTCRAGTCGADLQVACYSTSEVRPVTAALGSAGSARTVNGNPLVLVVEGDDLYAGLSYFGGSSSYGGVAVLPLDDRLATTSTQLTGNDIEGLAGYAGTVLATNAATNLIAILDAGGTVLDEVTLPGTTPNPHGLAVLGSTAYVALYGDGPGGYSGATTVTGQKIAKVDLSGVAACAAGTASTGCAAVSGTIDLTAVDGAADADAYPFPSKVAARGTKVYVALANLKYGECGTGSGYYAYCVPAGDGKLAVIDTASDDAVSIVDLGASCRNPGALAFSGSTLWVACGSYSFATAYPGVVVPVDFSGSTPAVGTAVDASAVVPGGLAICGGLGYVTDQASGAVLRFDPGTGAADAPVTVCPISPGNYGYAYAADIACP